jgi:hypothetical protein
MSSCLRSASRLALAAESFAAAALSAHLLASCRRCSERVLILQVADYFAATALPGGVWGGRAAHSPRTQTTPGYRVGCSYLLSRACCDAQQPPFEDGGHVASGCRASRWLPQLVPASHSKWMGPAHIGPEPAGAGLVLGQQRHRRVIGPDEALCILAQHLGHANEGVSGVRTSWLMLARNCDLCWLASAIWRLLSWISWNSRTLHRR